jgi:hypothetical protein
MQSNRRTLLGFGVLLILAGLTFAALQLFHLTFFPSWPFIVMGAGVALLVLGVLINVPDLAVPACIVAGVGGILYYTALTGHWEAWAFLWTLIPGFVAIGMFLAWVLGARKNYSFRAMLDTLITSLVMFAIFFAIFGSIFGYFTNGLLQSFWPLLLVAAGVLILIRGLFRIKKA